MIYKPITPCGKDCADRNVDYCYKCEKLKQYKAQMNEYYEADHREKSVDRAFYDYRDLKIKEKQRKSGYKNFFNR